MRALRTFRPDLAVRLRPLVLFNSRAPRPGERDGVDYHFRRREEIERLRADARFAVFDVRGDVQAVDLDALRSLLDSGDALFEGNPFVGCALLAAAPAGSAEVLSVFLSPLSRDELIERRDHGEDVPAFVAEVMRRKLLRRMARQKGPLSQGDLEEVERRCGSAWRELGLAHRFGHVLVNHDGEDSEHWDAFGLPIGEARRALHAFSALLEGVAPAAAALPEGVERWEEGLIEAR